MSAVEGSPSLPTPQANVLARISVAAALYRLPVYLACTAVALAISLALGKDLDWDTFNYHFYSGFSAFHDRFGQDYFAAGLQSYFNPYAFAPFYALTSAGFSALEIGALLTVWHSVILWLTYELAVAVCPDAPPRTRAIISVLAVVLALLNPVLLGQIGSTFVDIPTAELALAGWVLLAAVVRMPRLGALLGGAALLGAATALKLSNFVFAVAGIGLLLFVPLGWRGKLRFGAIYTAALGLAFAVVAAPWSYRLAKSFGNPFFPLLNNIFRSPQFTAEPLHFYRFIPGSFSEALWRPFAMLDPTSMIHFELRAPDGRYALLAVLACALLGKALWRRFGPSGHRGSALTAPSDARCAAALGCGFAIAWALWLMTSGNSRYFLPMACASGVLIAVLLPRLVGDRPRVWIALLLAAGGLQLYQVYASASMRWHPVPWDSGPWLGVQVPEKLAAEPALYLSIGVNSSSYLAPYVSKDAGFISFTGWYALGPDGASGEHVQTLIRRYAQHLRMLAPGDRLYPDLKHLPNVSDVDGALARFGLRSDPSDCATVTVKGSLPEGEQPGFTTYLVSCHVVPDPSARSAQSARREATSLVLDRLEDACPELFQPRRPLTELRNNRWQRQYLSTDITAWVSRGYLKWFDPVTGDGPVFLGPESDWTRAPQRVACGRRDGHYFARLLPPSPP